MTMVLFFSSFSVIENANLAYSEDYDQLLEFKKWAQIHDISLIGINKNSDILLEYGFDPSSNEILIEGVPNVLNAAEILYIIPENLLESMKGKTIYFSTENGRGLALISSYHKPIENMNDGIIIEQNIDPYYVVHELGHIIDLEQPPNLIKKELFSIDFIDNQNNQRIPNGYVSFYSLTNAEENFAEHFAHYVVNGEDFRKIAESDVLIEKKYNFLKNYVFDGIEF